MLFHSWKIVNKLVKSHALYSNLYSPGEHSPGLTVKSQVLIVTSHSWCSSLIKWLMFEIAILDALIRIWLVVWNILSYLGRPNHEPGIVWCVHPPFLKVSKWVAFVTSTSGALVPSCLFAAWPVEQKVYTPKGGFEWKNGREPLEFGVAFL